MTEEEYEKRREEQQAAQEAKKREAQEERRKVRAALREFAKTEQGTLVLNFLRRRICQADLYPYFRESREDVFWMGKRSVWGEIEKILNS